jgi:5'-3' exonuclease
MTDRKIALIDADNILFYATMGNKVLGADGEPLKDEKNRFIYTEKTLEEVYEAAQEMIKFWLDFTQPTHYIGFLGGEKSFRYTIYPDYKGNRKNLVKPKFYDELKEYLINEFKFIKVNGIEADDAANICRFYFENSFIISPDKDILYLQGKHYDSRNNKWVETDYSESEVYFWSDMITGQTGDNIKGIPGKGPAYVSELFLNSKVDELPYIVLRAYINSFGLDKGIDEYYKNFKCLSILKICDSNIFDPNNLTLTEVK